MKRQLETYAELLPLGGFVGFPTDSRSFLSYTRHEYFRRVLCSVLGGWAESGLAPADNETLGQIVRDISYDNALRYFNFPPKS